MVNWQWAIKCFEKYSSSDEKWIKRKDVFKCTYNSSFLMESFAHNFYYVLMHILDICVCICIDHDVISYYMFPVSWNVHFVHMVHYWYEYMKKKENVHPKQINVLNVVCVIYTHFLLNCRLWSNLCLFIVQHMKNKFIDE